MLQDLEQIKQLINDHKYFLIVFPPADAGDCLAAALALKNFIEKNGKHAEAAASNFNLSQNFKFLPGIKEVKPALSDVQKFIIKIDVSQAPIENLSYDVKDNWLSIYLSPKRGSITKNELRTAQSTFKYETIIVLGAPDLTSLGDIYANNTDLFYKTPIVNIDRRPGNERFGQINYLDLIASSVSETIYKLIKTWGEHFIDADLATILLSGITSATKSFTSTAVTPDTLRLAGELIDLGAEREKIISHLYRTHSVATLKLWGQALANVNLNKATGILHTFLTRDDFVKNGANTACLLGIVEYLLSNSPEAKLILVIYEDPNDSATNKIHGLLAAGKHQDALTLIKPLAGCGTKERVAFILENKNLKSAEETILKIIAEKNC